MSNSAIAIEPLKHALGKSGWALLDHSAGSYTSPEAELLGLAQQLGKVVGNIQHPLTILRPKAPSESRLNTLSKKYGIGDFHYMPTRLTGSVPYGTSSF